MVIVQADDPGLGLGIGVVTNKSTIEIGVGAAKEHDIGALKSGCIVKREIEARAHL